MNWMLFYNEHSMNYYLFNGEDVIAVKPGTPAFDWESNGDSETGKARHMPVLREAAVAVRARFFRINKTRYHISNRGVFLSE